MQPLAVVEVGIFSPVGLDARQTAASIWAGVPRKQECPIVSRHLQPIVMGYLPSEVLPTLVEPLAELRPAMTPLQRRLLRLATPALHEVLAAKVDDGAAVGEDEPRFASSVLPPGLTPRPPLLVAGPRPSANKPEIISGRILGQLALQAGVPVDVAASRIFPTGHAGFFAALSHAQTQIIEPGRSEFAVVGGMDSYFDLVRLAALEGEDRLLTQGAQDAFTPGEAAAFVLVASRVTCRRYRLEPLAWIDALGVGQEPGHRYSDAPYRGEGLAAAFGEAFAQGDPQSGPVQLVMAGFNGESMHAKEWGVAHIRNRKHFSEALRIEHSAEYTGDPGAALAPLMLGITALALRNKEIEGPTLVWGSSDFGERGALRVRAA